MSHTLLLADDSVTIQKVVGITFASEDVELVTVDNGDTALERAREVKPDLILADVHMPGLSGYELCRAIRSEPALAKTPVLLLTGSFESYDEAHAREAGASAQLAKPFEAQALLEAVRTLLTAPPEVTAPTPEVSKDATVEAGDTAADTAGSADTPSRTDFSFDDLDFDAPTPVGAEQTHLLSPDSIVEDSPEIRPLSQSPSAVEPLPEDLTTSNATTAPLTPPVRPETGEETQATEDAEDSLYRDLAFIEPLGDEVEDDHTRTTLHEPPRPLDAAPTGQRPEPAEPEPQSDAAIPRLPAVDEESSEILGDPLTSPASAPSVTLGEDSATHHVSTAPLVDPPAAPVAPEEVLLAEPATKDRLTPDPKSLLSSEEGLPILEAPEESEGPPTVSGEETFSAPEGSALDLAVEPQPSERPPRPDQSLAGSSPPPPREEPPLPPELPTSPTPPPLEAAASLPDPTVSLDPPAAVSAPGPEALRTEDAVTEPEPPTLSGSVAGPPSAPSAEGTCPAASPALDPSAMREVLEKLAWEAFGPLTEQLVRDVVSKIEAVAWEVIPELAERVIREEIERMKSESSQNSS
ncbi:MAG: response regulator [Myxococcota bacterium]